MPIPQEHSARYLYHFTHIENLESLLSTGFLANNHCHFPSDNHLSIAEQDIQNRRAQMLVTCGPGGVVHDYVPLYFGSLSPMLLGVIHKKNVDQHEMLYFEYPISLLDQTNAVFTSASANTQIPPSFFSDPQDLAQLNWDEIDSLKWRSASDDLKHQRMAEALIHMNLPLSLASRVIVWDGSVKDHLENMLKTLGVTNFPPIEFESPARRHWYTKFMEKSQESLVTGPHQIKNKYENACHEVASYKAPMTQSYPFQSLDELLTALQNSYACISHTRELIDLWSANGLHKLSVDKHTAEVVSNLTNLQEFKDLPPEAQRLTELAAHLHDIGKGPKSRWTHKGGVQQVDPDHPIRALPMMVDILTNMVSEVPKDKADILLKLVCYHDLVGEVLGKGRDASQIVEIAYNPTELLMLFAIGKADATSLCETWWDDTNANELYEKCLSEINK